MKEQDSIPSTKIERALKFAGTGVKIGGNYIKHYSRQIINGDTGKEVLHEDNARDVYETLSQLKGSALKVAQMLSMDRNLLPKAYQNKFQMAQYSAPPLSGPLVVRTFEREFGKSPQMLFDTFDLKAGNAASIGQVHKATKDGKTLAVKVQYPGVADSIKSDLKMVKPIALRLVGMSEKELGKYMKEVEDKLIEETDYQLELKRSIYISTHCAHIKNLVFPKYYAEYSGNKVLTMDWLTGLHLNDFLKTNPSQEVRNKIGQAIWDFYEHQIHQLKAVHADPHPGNFLLNEDGVVGVIDFGCVKEITDDIYYNYFGLILPDIHNSQAQIERIGKSLEVIYDTDTPEEKDLFLDYFMRLTKLTAKPFQSNHFDFGNGDFIKEISTLGEEIASRKEFRQSKQGRGSRHTLYINRTFFGLYQLLNDLKAVVQVSMAEWDQPILQWHKDEQVRKK
jgi:predicted unusual protein kinase regulating ubiquinone biosynthesis (AarF/ABC1/UbiB family)